MCNRPVLDLIPTHMSSPVELIKERLSITDVVGAYLRLEKAGSNLKAKCPFHNERTPSFFVSPSRGSYYCFGCGAKGDMFSFVQAFEGIDFIGALKALAARAGVEITPEDPRARNERERLFSLLDAAALFFQRNLEEHKLARDYLAKRGISDETLHAWRVGFAPDSWHGCSDYCVQKGFDADAIAQAGLSKTENGKTYDRFRSRVMFPIFDSAGRVVAFSGRIHGKESEKIPKYLNSPETSVFSKSRVLYGFDRAKNEIRRKDFTMLVEGQMDLLMCHQAGFSNTVASSGTAFTQEQLVLLKRLSKRILMVYDADKAGIQASLRSATLALSAGMEVKVVALPAGTDPAELILKDVDRFKQSLRSSSHIIDFYLAAIRAEKLDERGLVRSIRDQLLPFVVALESSIERDHFIRRIAELTGIREEALREDLAKISTAHSPHTLAKETKDTVLSPRRHLVERLMCGLLFWQSREEKRALDMESFEKELERILGKAQSKQLLAEAKTAEDELAFQAESYYRSHESLEQPARELLLALEEDTLKEELAAAMKTLSAAEKEHDAKQRSALLAKCQELTHRLHDLKKVRNGNII